nr:arsenate reductase ArsC [Psychrobacter sp. PraFG1]UNK06547.1 arsenate reductase ArsC [Psychrobacter sp. PraFG1]
MTNQYQPQQDAQSKTDQKLLVAKSAGSAPVGQVHPLTLEYLTQAGYSVEGLTSNGWDDKEYMQGFEPDVLITVCDNAAGEQCPLWLGNIPNLVKLHWGLSDPSKDTQDATKTAQTSLRPLLSLSKESPSYIRLPALSCQLKRANRRCLIWYITFNHHGGSKNERM